MEGWRVIACGKTHVATNNIRLPVNPESPVCNVQKMTLARLLRAHVQMGSIFPKTVILIDEISLCTLQDWQECILPLIALGCAVWCCGDMKNQLQPIGSQWCGVDRTEDYSEHSMVVSALQKRLTLTEGHRCDARLFEFLSSMSSGYLSTLNLEDLMTQCRAAFPSKGIPAQTNLCLCHVTRKRVITTAQRLKMRKDRPAGYLVLQGPLPLGQKLYIYLASP